MDIRHPVHPEHGKNLDTEKLRKEFLITGLFKDDSVNLTYSHVDRIIVGGIKPVKKTLTLSGGKELGSDYFLERREMGVINVGGAGTVTVDGKKYSLENEDGMYIGMGSKELLFSSLSAENPAYFYLNSTPAHHKYPDVKIAIKDARPVQMGDDKTSNRRTIYQYLHPDVLETCQLSMGLTKLAPANVWNTMPVHTHERRMEVYFYFNIPEKNVVFHLLGEPSETRHIVVRNLEAVISPSWSIHSGVGSSSYTFIWGMAGENKTFTDMDHVDMDTLK